MVRNVFKIQKVNIKKNYQLKQLELHVQARESICAEYFHMNYDCPLSSKVQNSLPEILRNVAELIYNILHYITNHGGFLCSAFVCTTNFFIRSLLKLQTE